jgi:hypothetical protein
VTLDGKSVQKCGAVTPIALIADRSRETGGTAGVAAQQSSTRLVADGLMIGLRRGGPIDETDL